MNRLVAAGAALGLAWAVQVSPAEARSRPDPGVIVYVSDRDSTSEDAIIDEVYALNPRTREVTRLTYDEPGVERWPVVSPDGRSLAWVRWEIDAAGVPRQDLAAIYRCDLLHRHGALTCRHSRKVVGPVNESVIAWTADSRHLIYQEPLTAEGDADLYRVDVRTGRTRNLTHDVAPDGVLVQDGQPAVSPDGRHFVYSQGSTGPTGADLYRRDIDGSNPVQLTAAPGNDNAAEYSPDGTHLVFHSTRDGDADIYTMRTEPEGPQNAAVNLTDGLRSADGETASQERSASYSPDGREISFWWFTDPPTGSTAGFTDGEVYRMRADGTHVRNLTRNNPTDPEALSVGDIQPDWGPTRRPQR